MPVSASDLRDDPHEGRHVVAEADGCVVFFLTVAAWPVALRTGVAALLVTVAWTFALVLGTDRVLAGAALGNVGHFGDRRLFRSGTCQLPPRNMATSPAVAASVSCW